MEGSTFRFVVIELLCAIQKQHRVATKQDAVTHASVIFAQIYSQGRHCEFKLTKLLACRISKNTYAANYRVYYVSRVQSKKVKVGHLSATAGILSQCAAVSKPGIPAELPLCLACWGAPSALLTSHVWLALYLQSSLVGLLCTCALF